MPQTRKFRSWQIQYINLAIMHDIFQKYDVEARAYLGAKFYTSNNIFWFPCHKGFAKQNEVI